MIIPKSTYKEMTEDVEVLALFPNIQVDVFRSMDEYMGSGTVGIIVSTTYDNILFSEYHSLSEYIEYEFDIVVEDLKDFIKGVVILSIN